MPVKHHSPTFSTFRLLLNHHGS